MTAIDTQHRMSREERRASMSLASLFGLRMLGLFLILPVLSIAAAHLHGGSNLFLVGLALGVYGLTQALFQIPFGMASDRWGRKPVIAVGLLIFAGGSFLAAIAHSVVVVILGRALQGAGAISSTVIALAADLTKETNRTKAMAMIGSMIGVAFALALILSPALYNAVGLGGLFVATGILGLLAIVALYTVVPHAPKPTTTEPPLRARELPSLIRRPELLRLNLGIFVLHLSQIALFVVIPPLLVSSGLPLAQHWELYLPVMLLAFVCMVPAIIRADKYGHHKQVLLGAVGLLVVAEALLALVHAGLVAYGVLLFLFFLAFNTLEALLPSLVSRMAPAHARGTAVAIYNTTQMTGLFIGGALGGYLAQIHGATLVFAVAGVLAIVWFVVALGMQPPAPTAQTAHSS